MPDQVVIITGAGKGIGRATALRLAAGGGALILNARTAADLEALKAEVETRGGRAEVVPGDAADPAVVDRMVTRAEQAFGVPTGVVTCAGFAPLLPIEDLDPDTFDLVLNLNIRAVYLLTRAVWPHMQARRRGTLVHVSSMGSVDPFTGFAAYGGSKAFVNTFVKGIAAEGADLGIRAYAVAPGAVDTDMLRGLFPDFPQEQRLSPDDVARTIVSLLDGSADTPSGETVFVTRQPA